MIEKGEGNQYKGKHIDDIEIKLRVPKYFNNHIFLNIAHKKQEC